MRSIFDIPYLMKKSTKPDLYYEDSVLQILRSEISELRGYLSRFCSSKELPEIMGSIMRQQFELYLEDMELEAQNAKNLYQDYLFSRTCSIIADAFEKFGLNTDARAVRKNREN